MGSQGCSSFSKSWAKGSSGSSHGGACRGGGLIPTCYCGDIAVMKVAKTTKNAGRNFWGCPHYKGGSSIGNCCNFFKWCCEDNVDEKDCTILKRISELENAVKDLQKIQKMMKLLVVALCMCIVVDLVILKLWLG
ncbi:uncharacterized protein LOC128195248 [Vigna angularis]|uniref:uncharacterized protein LOC128195248 n=1 Tax=Phaseolus angularis TaxID=3914 RepID=UPI0022B47BC9|nr:uncharacterized protein LOC128195248 [Vigna angularis]